MELLQLVRFCVLMENGRGVIDKSADYILEKFEACRSLEGTDVELLKGGLDLASKHKFERWIALWRDK